MTEHDPTPGELIDATIADLGDWRGAVLADIRRLIHTADPDIAEEVKWRKPSNSMRGVPTWCHAGTVCTGETYDDKVELTFAHGASLDDPDGLFNSSLGGRTRRAIDVFEDDRLDGPAFIALVRRAVDVNQT